MNIYWCEYAPFIFVRSSNHDWILAFAANRTSLQVKRPDLISKSPIYAHFSETLSGLSTVRAYNKQEQARVGNMENIDVNQRAFFAYIASNGLGANPILANALFCVLAPGSTHPTVLCLALTFSLQVVGVK